jgi:hypothetical protein
MRRDLFRECRHHFVDSGGDLFRGPVDRCFVFHFRLLTFASDGSGTGAEASAGTCGLPELQPTAVRHQPLPVTLPVHSATALHSPRSLKIRSTMASITSWSALGIVHVERQGN